MKANRSNSNSTFRLKADPPTAPRRLRAGFTLFEMLLVLTILVLLAGVAYVLLGPAHERHLLSSAAEGVRSELARTRIHAVDSGLTYQFRYEIGGDQRRYLIVPYEIDQDFDANDTGAAAADLKTRYPMFSMQLPEGYRFVQKQDWENDPNQISQTPVPIAEEFLESFSDAMKLKSTSWSAPILFAPDGTADSYSVVVTDSENRTITLTVRELTGAVSVGEIKQAQP